MLDKTGSHYFLSFTGVDREWADWIGYVMTETGHHVSNHNWEIKAGQNFIKWMNEHLNACDHIICLLSNSYVEAAFSRAEAEFGSYDSISGEDGKLIPIVIEPCEEIPPLMKPLKRLHIHGLPEVQVEKLLTDFLLPPSMPQERPRYPGGGE